MKIYQLWTPELPKESITTFLPLKLVYLVLRLMSESFEHLVSCLNDIVRRLRNSWIREVGKRKLQRRQLQNQARGTTCEDTRMPKSAKDYECLHRAMMMLGKKKGRNSKNLGRPK
ncbi:hypothetical protein PIB30_001156 [Stylosanthes scabra]|uniref:Uncharacterized protein n=1 Tax=Stylosanthes scabra TaxID=79078 RepID=A0ABU6V3B3_9FABA|nr:hypothetical protein [Stylosanthes scabra]